MHNTRLIKSSSSGTGYKTGTLQQTQNFTWNIADALGKGATATVYFGRHKVRHDKVYPETLAFIFSKHAASHCHQSTETDRSRSTQILKF